MGLLRRSRGVGDDSFEFADVLQQSLTPQIGEAAQRLRTLVLNPLPDFHQPGLLQRLQMPAQISVGQRAEILQVAKEQTAGMRRQRRQNPEPGLFVDRTIEAIVGITPRLVRDRRLVSIGPAVRHVAPP